MRKLKPHEKGQGAEFTYDEMLEGNERYLFVEAEQAVTRLHNKEFLADDISYFAPDEFADEGVSLAEVLHGQGEEMQLMFNYGHGLIDPCLVRVILPYVLYFVSHGTGTPPPEDVDVIEERRYGGVHIVKYKES